MTKELTGGRIRITGIQMDYKHRNETLISTFPLEGPGAYQEVMSNITNRKLLRPTTAQTLSLLDFVLSNPNNEQCEDILFTLRNYGLWTSTENLWLPEEVIVYDNIDGEMPSDRESLLKRFEDGDRAVRVVPYGFRTGNQSISDLVANTYMIAQVGDKDFAEDVVARVAKKVGKLNVGKVAKKVRKLNAEIYALGHPSEEDIEGQAYLERLKWSDKRYTAIQSCLANGKCGLLINGSCDNRSVGGSASAVLSESAKNSQKIFL